jgi:succinyl-CoA synthetase beta subunit
MDIEEAAHNTPHNVLTFSIDPPSACRDYTG